MKKKIYDRPTTVILPLPMFEKIKEITDSEGLSVSDFIRDAIEEKLATGQPE